MRPSEARGLPLSSQPSVQQPPRDCVLQGSRASPAHGPPTARAARLEGRGLRCLYGQGKNQLHWGRRGESQDPKASIWASWASIHPSGPLQPRSGGGPCHCTTLGEGHWTALGPLGFPSTRAETKGVRDAGRPHKAPGEQTAHTISALPRMPTLGSPGPAVWGAEPPPGYSRAPKGLPLARWQLPLSSRAPHLERPAALISRLAWCGPAAGV